MNRKALKLILLPGLLLLFLAGFLTLGTFPPGASPPHEEGGGFSLVRPAIAEAAAGSFLSQEAGICAYVNVGQTIDPSRAKSAFRTVEAETSEYIIGSVPLEGLGQGLDVHCYVRRDGWVVAYYLKNDPTCNIFRNHEKTAAISANHLTDCLSKAGSALGVRVQTPQYYHFGYASANMMMKIVGQASVMVPSEFEILETSGSSHGWSDSWEKRSVTFSPATLTWLSYDCTVLVYREP